MSTSETLLDRLVEILRDARDKKLRTSEVIQAANVERREGEAAVSLLIRRGVVLLGPDSTLRLRDEPPLARAVGVTQPRSRRRRG